jgi:hypothetical protein
MRTHENKLDHLDEQGAAGAVWRSMNKGTDEGADKSNVAGETR